MYASGDIEYQRPVRVPTSLSERPRNIMSILMRRTDSKGQIWQISNYEHSITTNNHHLVGGTDTTIYYYRVYMI